MPAIWSDHQMMPLPRPSEEPEEPHISTRDSDETTQVEIPVEQAIDAEADIPLAAPLDGKLDASQPPPPPNGGLHAWIQVLGSFFLYFNCWGTVNTFGVFQTYYSDNPHWNTSPSNISWIGSLQAFLLMMIGVIAGPIYDLGYFRSLLFFGTFMISFGLMMTSLCREYWQVLLAQGVVIGLGNGCLFVVAVAIIPQYFSTRKSLANGIAAAGSSIGGVVYPIVFRHLQQQVDFAWATRILGFIALATNLFSIAVMRQRIMPKQTRKLWEFEAFREPPYTFYCLATFLGFASFYGPIYYIQSYAIDTGIASEDFAFYLLPILNAASVPGRIIPNFIGDYIGPINILFPGTIIAAIMALVWIGVSNLSGVIVFACLYGFFSGTFVSMAPVGIVVLTPDMRKIGTRIGQNFFATSFGLLIGAPITGAIFRSTGHWLGPQIYIGVMLLACAFAFLAARTAKVGWKLMVRA